MIANAAWLIVEVGAGLVLNSLALLADAAHMLSDVAGLAIALGAQQLLRRPASQRHTYGLQRAEVLGALANGLLLLVAVSWIGYEAVHRLAAPEPVAGGGLAAVAAAGLAINVASAVVLLRARGKSLNMHGAFVHMALDALGSAAALAAGVVILVFGTAVADPVASLAVAGLVLFSTWGLLRDTVHVLLEGAPRDVDPLVVERALAGAPGVEDVHHLHIWNLASDVPALSAHVVIEGDVMLHDAQVIGDRLRALLEARFGIEHATLELECHACDPQGAPMADRR
ncbi:cation diffusion facilitator family transporter [soil metagenome]